MDDDQPRIDIHGQPITHVPDHFGGITTKGQPTKSEQLFKRHMRELWQQVVSEDQAIALITTVVTKALNGDMDALKYCGDNLWGPATKTVDIDQSDNRTINVFKFPDWWSPPAVETSDLPQNLSQPHGTPGKLGEGPKT